MHTLTPSSYSLPFSFHSVNKKAICSVMGMLQHMTQGVTQRGSLDVCTEKDAALFLLGQH